MKDEVAISFDGGKKSFHIKTRRTSYIIAVIDGFPAHVYYGKRIEGSPTLDHLMLSDIAFLQGNKGEEGSFRDMFPFEYPSEGKGDFRCTALSVRNGSCLTGCDLKFKDYRILDEKKPVKGMPSSHGDNVSSLELILSDTEGLIEVTLTYSAFVESDVITKSVVVKNTSEGDVILNRVMSSSLDIPYEDTKVISLPGSWARERMTESTPVGHGQIVLSSDRGTSSHQMNPAFAVANNDANEDTGSVWGLALVYSGSFTARIERTQFERVRIVAGISDNGFEWTLAPQEEFVSPEIAL